jgi:hypothetical protein
VNKFTGYSLHILLCYFRPRAGRPRYSLPERAVERAGGRRERAVQRRQDAAAIDELEAW